MRDLIGRGISGAEICRRLGLTRQAVHKHLRRLMAEGRIVKYGATKAAVYRKAGALPPPVRLPAFRRTYSLQGLEEDRVYYSAALYFRLPSVLPGNVQELLHYAFTEMLNNAVEHSRSARGTVEVVLDEYQVRFVVRDRGIGVFHSIATNFDLKDEYEAAAELLKGKATTMAERHSGEGIFFTSKAADEFALRSHDMELVVDNKKRDAFLSKRRFLKGTEVRFSVSCRSRRRLKALFDEFAPAEYDFKFERTRVQVRLAQPEYVSRSEAKRLLARLEHFREIILDFKGVRSMGQGFADEVFRVFTRAHPDVILRTENVMRPIETMIRHVVDKKL